MSLLLRLPQARFAPCYRLDVLSSTPAPIALARTAAQRACKTLATNIHEQCGLESFSTGVDGCRHSHAGLISNRPAGSHPQAWVRQFAGSLAVTASGR